MTISAVAFFCEDIRQESEGRFTLIGIYPDNIALQGPPTPAGQSILLPKMSVFTRISFDPTYETAAISAKMINPDGSETDLGAVDPQAFNEAKKSAIQQKNPIAGVNLIMQMTPFPVPQLGRYRLEVRAGKETFTAGMLNVGLAPTA